MVTIRCVGLCDLICECRRCLASSSPGAVQWCVLSLSPNRTLAAGGVDNVEPVFADFQRMVLYTYLMPAYAGRTWVRVDGDQPGCDLVVI